MAIEPPRGPPLRPLSVRRDAADEEETDTSAFETPSIPETTEERGDTTEIVRPHAKDATEILPHPTASLPPRVPQQPPGEEPPRARARPARSRMVPIVGLLFATAVGVGIIAILVLLIALGV
jgi:hypothetical protein